MLRMLGIDPYTGQVSEVGKPAKLRIGIVNAIFRVAGRTSQEH
jgi:hypothetical protein